jgi:hypothetical protein
VKHVKNSTLRSSPRPIRLSEIPRRAAVHYSLETAPEFIVLENVGLKSGSNQSEDKRGLSVTLDIATYFRSGDVGE